LGRAADIWTLLKPTLFLTTLTVVIGVVVIDWIWGYLWLAVLLAPFVWAAMEHALYRREKRTKAYGPTEGDAPPAVASPPRQSHGMERFYEARGPKPDPLPSRSDRPARAPAPTVSRPLTDLLREQLTKGEEMLESLTFHNPVEAMARGGPIPASEAQVGAWERLIGDMLADHLRLQAQFNMTPPPLTLAQMAQYNPLYHRLEWKLRRLEAVIKKLR
jgi:hypothetical protein